MIRTDTVDLTVIKAVAFRQKLMSGGSGITILRYDMDQPGIASISKTSGEPIPTDNTPADVYPAEAFREAIKLTAGMPYKKRGGVRVSKKSVKETPPEKSEEVTEEDVIIDSGEYQKLVEAYTDKNGKLSYDLLNRDLIRFAHASKIVRTMIEEGTPLKKVRSYIICTKFRSIIGSKKPTEAQVLKMADLLDEVSPKSAFKTLDAELRKQSAAIKKK
ncbi:MAG: hypothetical protein J5859_01705 [Clostridia bacterium]|nr:hypothetical protein [Clostridia bacterium]